MIAKSKPKRALTLARNCGQNEWLGLVVGICKGRQRHGGAKPIPRNTRALCDVIVRLTAVETLVSPSCAHSLCYRARLTLESQIRILYFLQFY